MTKQLLVKTCSSCGVQKPLTAFMQMAGPEGTSYGNICSACRSAEKDKPIKPVEDETSKSRTGHGIDSKTKVKSDTVKKEEQHRTEEEYHEERDETEELAIKKNEITETKIKAEKDHRESMRFRGFLSGEKKPATTATQQTVEKAAKQAHFIEEVNKQERAGAEEQREKGEEFTGPAMQDTQMGNKLKRGAGFRNLAQLYSGFAAIGSFAQNGKKAPATAAGKDPLVEFVEDNFKNPNRPPGGRRQ